jgi:virulence factor Mce-like protein
VSVVGYFASLGLRIKPPDGRTNLSMEVRDINGLAVGSNVLLRGVAVGKVSKIETTIQAATVDFYVSANYRVPVDSEIQLENLSALGESYIGLIPRTNGGPLFQNGQRIVAQAVTQPPSITELAASVVRVLDQLDPGALQRVIAESDAALPDPAAILPNISRASTLLRNTVADFHGSGRAVFDNIQTLLENAEYVAPALSQISPSVRGIGVYAQDLVKHFPVFRSQDNPDSLIEFGKLFTRVQGLLDTSGPDLKVLGEAFLPKLNAISAALMNFDTGQMLTNLLDTVPPDGTVTLRVVP